MPMTSFIFLLHGRMEVGKGIPERFVTSCIILYHGSSRLGHDSISENKGCDRDFYANTNLCRRRNGSPGTRKETPILKRFHFERI